MKLYHNGKIEPQYLKNKINNRLYEIWFKFKYVNNNTHLDQN